MRIDPLKHLLTTLEADSTLLEPDQLRRRLEALDDLDRNFPDSDPPACGDGAESALLLHRATALRTKLEARNSQLYQSIREEIRRGAVPRQLLRWMQVSAPGDENEPPVPGLSYDWRDEVASGILQLREPTRAALAPGPEMVFFQPTPMRHLLRLIKVARLSEADILIDLGSGLGHVPLFASILTGAHSIGIEVEADYVASAQECARCLSMGRVRFIPQDARTADLSTGTVFYLYSPFTGTLLSAVIERLRQESLRRPIKICTLGPCTSIVANQPWLSATTLPDTEQITLFETRSDQSQTL